MRMTLVLVLLWIVPAPAEQPVIPVASGSGPRVFLLDAQQLQAARQRVRNGDKTLEPALTRLRQEAQGALKAGPFSVMHKDATPPSGDKHDYMSQAPYWWPNPDAPDGLPYVRRDGERNPEIYKITDHRDMGRMTEAVETLALAYWFTGDEAHADKAAQLLRAWFLDPATRMNPHLEYGQAVPGLNTGRGTGLIETICLTQVVDAVGLLAGSKAWTSQDQRDLQAWFSRFLQWMQESQKGKEEAAAKNNHGTYYDLQVASFALFVGRAEVATAVLQAAGPVRIGRQIEPDGRQPLELERTRAWSYSIMNLRGLMSLARIGENVGVDLWGFQTPDGRGIRKALDYLLPFALDGRKWPHRQLGGWSPEGIYPLLRTAAIRYPNLDYQAMVSRIPAVAPDDRGRLLRAERSGP